MTTKIAPNNIAARIEAAKEMQYQMRNYDGVYFGYSENRKTVTITWTNAKRFKVCAVSLAETMSRFMPQPFEAFNDTDFSGAKTFAILANGNLALSMVRHDLEMMYGDTINEIDLDDVALRAKSFLWLLLPLAENKVTFQEAIEYGILKGYADGEEEETELIAIFKSFQNDTVLNGTL